MKHSKEKGFTIIELMIAMAVLAFGILGYTFLNVSSLHNRTFSRELSQATDMASRISENLLYTAYDNPLLSDDNGEDPATTTKHPLVGDSVGTTGTYADFNFTIVSRTYTSPNGTSSTDKWYRIPHGNRFYYIRWEVMTGNSSVSGSPPDKVKLIRVFAAFDNKDPQTGRLVLGGYNPARIGPTILTFKTDLAS